MNVSSLSKLQKGKRGIETRRKEEKRVRERKKNLGGREELYSCGMTCWGR